jgi:hypothetical protein
MLGPAAAPTTNEPPAYFKKLLRSELLELITLSFTNCRDVDHKASFSRNMTLYTIGLSVNSGVEFENPGDITLFFAQDAFEASLVAPCSGPGR